MNASAKFIMVFATAALAASSTFANDNNVFVIKGKVIDDDGKPADMAEIRVQTLGRTAPVKIVKTDSRGQYIVRGLVPGNYTVTAYDSFGNPRSRALIKTDRKGWASVNFNLALDSMVGDDATNMKGQVHIISGHGSGTH